MGRIGTSSGKTDLVLPILNQSVRAAQLRRGDCHFMMLYQLGDALLRYPLRTRPVPSCR